MRKIDWYIFKKFIGTFFFAISLLIVVVIVFDVSENVDSFIKNHASLYEVVFHFYIPFIPYFINLFIYLFTFISVIFFIIIFKSTCQLQSPVDRIESV